MPSHGWNNFFYTKYPQYKGSVHWYLKQQFRRCVIHFTSFFVEHKHERRITNCFNFEFVLDAETFLHFIFQLTIFIAKWNCLSCMIVVDCRHSIISVAYRMLRDFVRLARFVDTNLKSKIATMWTVDQTQYSDIRWLIYRICNTSKCQVLHF